MGWGWLLRFLRYRRYGVLGSANHGAMFGSGIKTGFSLRAFLWKFGLRGTQTLAAVVQDAHKDGKTAQGHPT